MSENINFQPADPTAMLAAEAEHVENANLNEQAIENHLDGLQGIAEVDENRDAIKTAAVELASSFEIHESIAEQPGKMTLFTAIASRWSKAGHDEAEKTFLADSLALLAYNNSEPLKSVFDAANTEKTKYDDDHIESTIKRYTNVQMTAELNEAVKNGLLNGVKERLGVTAENEDPYEIAVLSISDSYATNGMSVRVTPWPNKSEYKSDAEYQSALQESNDNFEQVQDASKWSDELVKRGERFAAELGNENIPTAWKTELNGKTYLCMPQSFVEKILHPETFMEANDYYDKRQWESDVAVFEHEYTHTQGGLSVDSELFFGINLEELRAEEFSGNKNGYTDIKNFARDMAVVTGNDLVRFIEAKQKGGTQKEVFKEIAESIGLDAMLEVVMVQPLPYAKASKNALVHATDKHLGSYDGVTTRLMESVIENGGEKELLERVDARLDKLKDIDIDLEWFLSYRRNGGSNAITNVLEARAKELGYITA